VKVESSVIDALPALREELMVEVTGLGGSDSARVLVFAFRCNLEADLVCGKANAELDAMMIAEMKI
jgi:hypothetical protein